MSGLGKFLRILRLETSESLTEMANRLGYAITYLSGIENDKRTVPKNFCEKVAKEYELSAQKTAELKKILLRSNPVFQIENDGSEAKTAVLIKMASKELTNENYEEILNLVQRIKLDTGEGDDL